MILFISAELDAIVSSIYLHTSLTSKNNSYHWILIAGPAVLQPLKVEDVHITCDSMYLQAQNVPLMNTHTMMLLMGMCISLTKNPMNPIIANPIAVATAIFWNSMEKERACMKYIILPSYI